MKNGIRMLDIAKELGVSVVTVSNALNDRGGVGEDLRRRIRERASQLGYRPSAPRTVRRDSAPGTNESGNIGILTSERYMGTHGSFYWFLTASVSKELTQCNLYSVYETISAEDEVQCFLPNTVRDRAVRGIIVVGQLSADYLDCLTDIHLPVIFLDFYDKHSDIDAVVSDNYYDSYRLTDHLVAQGHRNIGFVGNVTATSSIHDRFLGYIRCITEHGLPYCREWTIDDRFADGKMMESIAVPKTLPTAFVCNCDETALRVIRQFQKGGLRIPQDLSITGYDNYSVSDIADPTITTVEVDLKEMARTAVELLLDRIAHPCKPAARHVIPGKFVHKESTAPPNVGELWSK